MADDDDFLLGGDDQVDYEGSDYDLDEDDEEEEERVDAQRNAEAAGNAAAPPPDASGGADAPPGQGEGSKGEGVRHHISAQIDEELRREPAEVRKHGLAKAQSLWTPSHHVPGAPPPFPVDTCRRCFRTEIEPGFRHAHVDPG